MSVEKIARRIFAAGLIIGAPVILDACKFVSPNDQQPAVATESIPQPISIEVLLTRARLADFIPPQILERFDAKSFEAIEANVYQLPVSDNIPTYVHVLDQSVTFNPNATIAAYEFFTQENLKQLIQKLKEGRRVGQDYGVNPNDPNAVAFRYEYSQGQTIGAMLLRSQNTTQRHLIVLSENQEIPAWVQSTSASTIHRDNIALSIINLPRIKARAPESTVQVQDANFYSLVEICQQMVVVGSPGPDGKLYPLDHLNSIIAQEGACNGLSLAALDQRLNFPWSKAEKDLNREGDMPVADPSIPATIMLFRLNEAAYNIMPRNGLLISNIHP